MTDTAMVPRKSEGHEPARPALIDEQLADQLLGRAQAEGVELLGPDGLLSQVTKAVLERALAEEMTGHLGYEKHDPAGRGSGNSRNGSTGKTLLTDVGAVELAVPRDRNGSFEPKTVRKGQTRLEGFNDRIVALYARGMTTRDIRAHPREMYDVDVSPDLISRVTDGVLEELAECQSRPLDRVYPVIFIGARTPLGHGAPGTSRSQPQPRSPSQSSHLAAPRGSPLQSPPYIVSRDSPWAAPSPSAAAQTSSSSSRKSRSA